MMQILTYPPPATWNDITRRPVSDLSSLEKSVKKILQQVKDKGDKAVKKYTAEFDGVAVKNLLVSDKEIDQAAGELTTALKDSIRIAKKNIQTFHLAQQQGPVKTETMPGVVCWRKSVAIERIGLYIPGGSAPLFSTVLMLAIPAAIAGCKQIVLCTPPGRDGTIHPAILYAAQLCGVTTIIKAGGVQAIGAMAYGTDSVPKVFKIFGPGNQYVTLAKQLVQQYGVAIDMPAGPSEVLIIADETANPDFIAADLLSQAEHGADSQVVLLTTQQSIADEVILAIETQLKKLPRREIAEKALLHSKLIIVDTINTALALSDQYAPEHLILCCADAAEVANRVQTAGSVFIGNYSPESAGDYASGTNHTLPTNGYAAMYSGVSVDSFVKKITYQQLTAAGLQQLGPAVMEMAAAEGLDAHRHAVAIRLQSLQTASTHSTKD